MTFVRLQRINKQLKDVYSDMTMRQWQVFLEVASNEGQTQFHYSKRCAESEPLVSRAVGALSKRGLLVPGRTSDDRSKAIFLTAAGRELVQTLLAEP